MIILGIDIWAWVALAVLGSAMDAGAAYVVYKWQAWRIDTMNKKLHPTEKNGLNLDLSYRIDGSEVFGVHGRGVDLSDMIDNMMRGFSTLTKHKDTVINDTIRRENEKTKT
jgi:hypothetical protein